MNILKNLLHFSPKSDAEPRFYQITEKLLLYQCSLRIDVLFLYSLRFFCNAISELDIPSLGRYLLTAFAHPVLSAFGCLQSLSRGGNIDFGAVRQFRLERLAQHRTILADDW